jgi:hypothetical protein
MKKILTISFLMLSISFVKAQDVLSDSYDVLTFAIKNVDKKVGDGSCWDFVNLAYKSGKLKKVGTYGWGKSISIDEVQPGDVVQFKDHIATVKIKTKKDTYNRGHHSAIVKKVVSGVNGEIEVYEQHVNGKSIVQTNKVYFKNYKIGNMTVNVTGSFSFYRPQK